MTDPLLDAVRKLAGEGPHLEEYQPDQPPLATFWRQGTQGTFYWRLLVPARHLPGRVNQLLQSDTGKDPMLRQEGVAIWQFLGDVGRLSFAARVQERGVRSLMEVDDNYMVPSPHIPQRQRKAWHSRILDSWADGATGYSHQAHRKILPAIDGLIVSTNVLANQYEPYVPAGIYVCPNSVDPDDWEPIQRVDRPVTVGFAGGDAHLHDLSLVERALDWAHRDGAALVKMGAGTRVWHWPHEDFPWTDDLAEYRRSLQKLDVGLCPLRRSSWHDSKSDIKAMEYLMAGVLPIVQGDTPVYADWVGVVPSASTPKEWERAVREVVALDADERLSMWKRAHDFLLANKTIDKHIGAWREAVNGRREMGRRRADQPAGEVSGVVSGMEAAA